MSDSEEPTVRRARELFEASVDALDGRTRSRLNQARQAALAELRDGRAAWRRWWWAPAGALASAVVLALWLRPSLDPEPAAEVALFEDLDVVADSGELELAQNLEFYAWLAEQPGSEGR